MTLRLAHLPFILVLLIARSTPTAAGDYFLHTDVTDSLEPTAPTGATAEYRDSGSVNRTTFQRIGTWAAAAVDGAMRLESLSDLHVWVGLKNSDDQGTYFDVRAEILKNGP